MSIFYCRLAKDHKKHIYQFLKKGLQYHSNIDGLRTLKFKDKGYLFCFKGTLRNKEFGDTLLKRWNICYQDDGEFLLALYCFYQDRIKEFITCDSFLLIDDGANVLIYSNDPLYYKRERRGEIYISNERAFLNEGNVFSLKRESGLFFCNNNLKAISL